MVGIIGAMHIEVETIKSLMENKTVETVSGVDYIRGTLHGKEIVIAVCGIGKVAAAMCTQTMILRYSPECIINTGVGGSLSTKLAIGDIAVAESLVQHDMDTSPLGDPKGLISGINKVYFDTDSRAAEIVLAAAERLGISAEQLGMRFGMLIGALFPLIAIVVYAKICHDSKKRKSE
mgnify:CR=1 FL=1